jgi:hypothetical protein
MCVFPSLTSFTPNINVLSKIREVYYTLRNIGISVSKIDFVIRSVLPMVDIDIDFLPSKSTAANITSELGLVARQQLTEEMNNITDYYTS